MFRATHSYSFMNDQGTRILLGDQPQGHLYLLTLTTSAETVQSLNLIQLGVVGPLASKDSAKEKPYLIPCIRCLHQLA